MTEVLVTGAGAAGGAAAAGAGDEPEVASVTSPVGYPRVHGRNYQDWFRKGAGVEARYDYLYSREELEPWAKRAKEVDAAAEETFVVTNNHYKGKAAANALMLKSLVSGKKSEAPRKLIETYPDQLAPLAKPSKQS